MSTRTAPVPAPAPAGRDLELDELVALARDLASRPAEWRDRLPKEDGPGRRFAQLWRDEHVDVWVIAWRDDHDTGYHDHDGSAGAMAVASGALLEERMVLGGPPRRRRVGPGEAVGFDGSHVHRVAHASDGPAISIHAYSPPLVSMGAYGVGPDGELRRERLSYVEELRPRGWTGRL